MLTLLLGIALFFSVHSVRIVADDWRTRRIERLGLNTWKGLYSLLSLAGLALIVAGYASTRGMAELWPLPLWTRHLAALLTLPAFVLVAAAYVPNNRIRGALGHPMLAGVKLWALAHLLANARPGDLLLFGAFLLWGVAAFVAARRRDRQARAVRPHGGLAGDLAVFTLGLLAWAGFAFYGHQHLIGVRPFG